MFGRWAFWRDESGATAALYALALPALVATAGIGIDYARIAAMDTELQNAADQAALAGVTQLDKEAGAIDRAIAAVQGGLVRNSTLFANDDDPGAGGATSDVDIPTERIFFYATREDAEGDQNRIDTSAEEAYLDAAFIRVQVEARTANYALTPVVGAISGTIDAEAVAGIGAALCRTPPLMICNPLEPTGNVDPNWPFDPDDYEGLGLLAKGGGTGGGAWAPGNFGFLDTIPGSGGGTPDLRKALGWNSPPGTCVSQSANDSVDTDTGNKSDIADSMNTRFDIYNGNTVCPTGGSCSSSVNSMKDTINTAVNIPNGNSCRLHNQGWKEATPVSQRYLPGNAALSPTTTPAAMGHPRDVCHAASTLTGTNWCGGPVGDGFWDRDAYFRSHYGWTSSQWQTNTGLTVGTGSRPRYPTRHQVYEWEIENVGDVIDGVTILGPRNSTYGQPVCGSSITPSDTVPDRRRLSVAVINCRAHNVRGNSPDVPVREFMDVFLVQPSLDRDRTRKDEIYVEVIGKTKSGSAGETAGTVIRRDVPYLIK